MHVLFIELVYLDSRLGRRLSTWTDEPLFRSQKKHSKSQTETNATPTHQPSQHQSQHRPHDLIIVS